MLIFKGVYPPFSSQWHLLEERIDLGPGLLWHAEHRETGCLCLSGAKLDFPGWKFLKQQQLGEKFQKILKELRSQTSPNRIPYQIHPVQWWCVILFWSFSCITWVF